MLSSEVKELINLLKTKLGGDEQDYDADFDDAFLKGKWFCFEESTDDHELCIEMTWHPRDPKELYEQKEEE